MFPLEIIQINVEGGKVGLDMISSIGSILQECVRACGAFFASCSELRIDMLVSQMPVLRHLTMESVALRLVLAMLFGGAIGFERGRKSRPAGFRTYMVVCLGATLTMILGQYELHMVETQWLIQAQAVGAKTDVTRFAAQVINGVGFLGAGTILITGRQQIKGLTTAAGLWASACMGLVIGAGFYECALLAFFLIMAVMWLLPRVEAFFVEKTRNMNVYIEFFALDGINDVIGCLKALDMHIYDMDIEHGKDSREVAPNAVFSLRLTKHQSHTDVVAALSQLECIRVIKEI